MLFSTAYFPPVEYFVLLARCSSAFVDSGEHYQKQSYRNRCTILTANGPMDLRFPIVHDGARLITEVKVDWSTPWLRQTEYAIDSAYYRSPFFEYYRDSLFSILDSRPETLWELNRRITEYFCLKIGIPAPVFDDASPFTMSRSVPSFTESRATMIAPVSCRQAGENFRCASSHRDASLAVPPFTGSRATMVSPAWRQGGAEPGDDFRELIHPKRPPVLRNAEYWQVFRDKFGFVPNMSVMDLLFCEGPESICYL